MPGGRPTLYSEELASKICAELASGKSLRTVCNQEGMPSRTSVFLWMSQYPAFSNQYAEAKEQSAEALAEEMFDIADAEGEEIQRSKLKVDVRKWYLSKIKPKKYGERITQEHSGPDGGPIETKVNDSELARQIAFALAQGDPSKDAG